VKKYSGLLTRYECLYSDPQFAFDFFHDLRFFGRGLWGSGRQVAEGAIGIGGWWLRCWGFATRE
jgi:hypothetical protein